MGFLIELCEVEIRTKDEAGLAISPELQGVLDRFVDVFATPTGLPPPQDSDH